MKAISHFIYDGYRLPVCGDYYGCWSFDGSEFRIYASVIDFEMTPQHIYKPIYEKEEPEGSLADRFDEWNW